jgi:NAD(P)-dependent dehydrogenase (short-subunit alcohol dehydrogenase family)
MKNVLVTNVTEYTGPGVVNVLCNRDYRVIGHDASFADSTAREKYRADTGCIALAAQTPGDIVNEMQRSGEVTRFVFNDAYPNTPKPFEEIDLETVNASFTALYLFPFKLSQLVLPLLKRRGTGSIAFITSARQLQPEPGFAVATSIRAGTTALALALAREAAPYGIQVNAIQPNYLYSEMYYPKAKFVDDPEGREKIAAIVPFSRLGQPEEFGELVEFFVSGRSAFTTGQIVNFTGGWP